MYNIPIILKLSKYIILNSKLKFILSYIGLLKFKYIIIYLIEF